MKTFFIVGEMISLILVIIFFIYNKRKNNVDNLEIFPQLFIISLLLGWILFYISILTWIFIYLEKNKGIGL